jgi:hypothetical protein
MLPIDEIGRRLFRLAARAREKRVIRRQRAGTIGAASVAG